MPVDYLARVARPAPNAINSGLSSCQASTLRNLLGNPRDSYTADCQPVTNRDLKRRIVTAQVGPLHVTGLDIAVLSLSQVLQAIRKAEPTLYATLGTAGMLCCRLVRGSDHVVSNHAWGTAIDLTINGRLDTRGDGQVYEGLLRCYPHFHAAGWYWGAEFNVEDAMHFELAEETFRRLNANK